jgi:hypothetical protein
MIEGANVGEGEMFELHRASRRFEVDL